MLLVGEDSEPPYGKAKRAIKRARKEEKRRVKESKKEAKRAKALTTLQGDSDIEMGPYIKISQ